MAGRARKTEQDQTQSEHEQCWDDHDEPINYHRGPRGRQYLCYTCNSRPCADRCAEQWMPDTLHLKASRANLTVEQWAEAHPDWIGWTLHAEREDVASFVAAQATGDGRQATGDSSLSPAPCPLPPGERRIPVGAAMEQALAVMAGQAQAETLAPVYERSTGGGG